MKKTYALSALVGTGLFFAGCGGGSGGESGSGTTPTGPVQTSAVGNASITYTGQLRATVTASSQAISSVGVAGAAISSMSYYPSQVLANTNILFSTGQDIYSYSNATLTATNLSHSELPVLYPSISNAGNVVFLKESTLGNYYDIWTMKSDGSSQRQITNGTPFVSAAISPGGSFIAAITNDDVLCKITTAGVLTVLVDPNGTWNALPAGGVSWSPDSTKIAYASTSGNIYVESVNGGNPTQISSGTTFELPAWTPDGTQILADNSGRIYALSSTGASSQTPLGLTGTTSQNFVGVTISPDGKKLVYYASPTSGTHGFFTSDLNGTEQSAIYPVSIAIGSPVVWSNYTPAETLVGAGGATSTSGAAGFVLSNTNKSFASLLSFTATTASTATIANASSTNPTTGPLEFVASADAITSVSYINSYTGSAFVKTGLTGTPQLVFGIDSTSGAISFVAPAASVKMEAKQSIARVTKGSTTVYTGKFTAVYNGQGTNLAPNGATSFTIDATTRKVLSVK